MTVNNSEIFTVYPVLLVSQTHRVSKSSSPIWLTAEKHEEDNAMNKTKHFWEEKSKGEQAQWMSILRSEH